MNLNADNLTEEKTELIRDAPPAHYSFKIHSFSLLSKNSVEKYESCVFKVGGYKWKMILHPSGDASKDVEDHISLYLVFADKKSLPPGWEVNVTYRFFIFDQIRDRYLTIGDAHGRVRRFHGIRTKWGFSRLISLETFTDPTRGYLVDDTCEFGVDVFILGNIAGGECLQMLDSPSTYEYSWIVKDFSQLDEEFYDSEVFSVGGHQWKIEMSPQGSHEGEKNSLSLFLYLADKDPLPSDTKVYATFKVRLRNQIHEEHIEKEGHYWFKSNTYGSGWLKFVSLDKFKDPTKGFLVDDSCHIEAEVTVLGTRKKEL